MIPVILSGGSGTRLWPLSRPFYPKQFLALTSDLTLFQETVRRLGQINAQAPMVICNEQHRFIVAENLRSLNLPAQQIILEPEGRNTAPAIAVAALMAMDNDKDAILIVLPADHAIQDAKAFQEAAELAEKLAIDGHLVTFGVKPTEPHTGYGYIEAGKQVSNGAYKISAFKEKPNAENAALFFQSQKYFWNSGMFVFKASRYLEELKKYEPKIYEHAKAAIAKGAKDLDFYRLDKSEFAQCKNISIDYAMMEHTDDGVVVMLDAQWCDVGSWSSLWKILDKDTQGNVVRGDVVQHDSNNNYVYSENKLVTTLGVDNLVIIDTKDALLIADRSKVEDVKMIVETLNKNDRSEAKHHRTVYRPWGYYDSIATGERDQVKRITVNPGAKLSVQMHHHRAEHWVVVKGTARVTKGEEIILLSENESVYLPLGIIHALENPGKIPLEIIEVQTGSYLGEDDIVRIEDVYGRVKETKSVVHGDK